MKISDRLDDIAALVLEQGQPELFKRLIRASVIVSKHNSDRELADGIEHDHSEDELTEVEDSEEVDDDEADDDDVEGAFLGFPAGALPHKERRRGPHEKDVGVGKPDWWNPN